MTRGLFAFHVDAFSLCFAVLPNNYLFQSPKLYISASMDNQWYVVVLPPRTSEEEEMASSSSNTPKESVVDDRGRRRTSCGYCRSSRDNSISHGPFPSLSLSSIQFFLSFYLFSQLSFRLFIGFGALLVSPVNFFRFLTVPFPQLKKWLVLLIETKKNLLRKTMVFSFFFF